MAAQMKTPAVYVVEPTSNSVVEVATAIPVFIGYTEKAECDNRSLTGVPTQITTLAEYERYFGGAPKTQVKFNPDGTPGAVIGRFYLYLSIFLFFCNGGGTCYIVSVGNYSGAADADKLKEPLAPAGALERELEPAMVVIPDAMLLPDGAAANDVAQAVLAHCGKMRSRIGIFDVFDGFKERTYGTDDVISGDKGFRKLTSDFLSYGAAYYPWLNTNLVDETGVDYTRVSEDCRPTLAAWLKAQAGAAYADSANADKLGELSAVIDRISQAGAPDPELVRATHSALADALPAYKAAMDAIRRELNLLPPSGGIAGVYARIDAAIGVQKAPANTGIMGAISPTVNISRDDQEDLNMPLNGMAINPIRVVPGTGLVIWGARTLDGNSQDFRYVSVRRTLIMLEQSIKAAALAYVFQPNNAVTWSSVRNMISDFLLSQWKSGVLVGSRPEEAFSVEVGLGSTMTENDVLDGYMKVVVQVCLAGPGEFIVISFQQRMAGY